eukprot:CAMPEP_0201521842 /NCGR_PEP_ID=MMETSP0161_2-20130828/16304_1 /ASSEMBLY_ACC=CAM_ASM_000251 /TAXON_ID=180227 /ORGANISM="Neoparamoeba aestuarina, Strain SoJaBio B1-5/56/2" /LENGTH=79 /DNA_ID=CAMNT_0047920557 /DNA_START=89 /DNA_END=325 /DNA_ORIENTATION=-
MSERYKSILFVTCGTALLLKAFETQRERSQDDDTPVYDGIKRRAYVRTGEDNYALVYPAVYRCASWSDLKKTILEVMNP